MSVVRSPRAVRAPATPASRRRASPAVASLVGPGAFALSVALYAGLSCVVRTAPFHPLGVVSFFDLLVYRASAGIVLAGHPLYAARFPGNLAFTYPPFAALVLCPLRLLPAAGDEIVVTAIGLGLLVVIARATLRLAAGRAGVPRDPVARTRIAWLAAAVAIWLEPVNTALGYGQIDVLIAALVVGDLARPAGARGRGMGIGLAAGLKLTPLVFVPYLLLSGRRRDALSALLTFAATVLVGIAVLPGDSRAYWGGAFIDTSRVSGRHHAGGGPADQSLRGLLLRLAPHEVHAWIVVAVIVGCAGVWLAARSARRGDPAAGFVICAVTGLLVSPISWTHQWTLAAPALLLLVLGARARRSLLARSLQVLAVLAFAAGSWGIWVVIGEHPLGLRLDWLGLVFGDWYVLAGLGVLLAAAVGEWRRRGVVRAPASA